jgi:hypothetical protein
VGLAIAGTGVVIDCTDEALAQALRLRYADFPPEGSPEARISVQVAQGETAGIEDIPQVKFLGETLELEGTRSRGFFDTAQGCGELIAEPGDPVMAVEYFLRMVYALLAFQRGGMLMHTAAIARQGRAYLFFGRSGAGKTTASRVSSGCIVLNDDLVLLLPEGQGWMAYGTPFWNPRQVRPARYSAPVAGVLRLIQDKHVFLEPMSSGEALAELLAGIPIVPADPQRSAEVLRRGARLLGSVPVYRLHFLPDNSFWRVIQF